MVEYPHWKKTSPPAERTARWAPPAGARGEKPRPSQLCPCRPAPLPITGQFALRPHGGVWRGRANADGAVRPPRTPLAMGPSSRRKALWEDGASFFGLGSRWGCSFARDSDGSGRPAASPLGPGAGQDPAACLSLGRLLPQPGRAKCSQHLNAWRAAACFGLRHVVETSGGPTRPRVRFSMPGDRAMGAGAFDFIDCVSGNF